MLWTTSHHMRYRRRLLRMLQAQPLEDSSVIFLIIMKTKTSPKPILQLTIAAVILLQSAAFAQAGGKSAKSDWVEDEDIPAANNRAPYGDSGEVQIPLGGSALPPQQAQPGVPQVPQLGNRGGYQPSPTYQRLYQQFFQDEDDDDDGFSTKRSGKKFMPLNQLPGSQSSAYNMYGNGSFSTPWASGQYAGIQQGFGAPMYVGPEVPYPTYPGGIQYGPPGLMPAMPYGSYGNFGVGPGMLNGFRPGSTPIYTSPLPSGLPLTMPRNP